MASPIFKCGIYILIAALTSLSAELSNIQHLTDVTPGKIAAIIIGVVLQALIAVRAFLDQSISNNITSSDNTTK